MCVTESRSVCIAVLHVPVIRVVLMDFTSWKRTPSVMTTSSSPVVKAKAMCCGWFMSRGHVTGGYNNLNKNTKDFSWTS